MKSENIKISVLIPTYNRANYLSQTIESVLTQDYPHLEIIVSDNASTDGTRELVQSFLRDGRVRYERNERNIGLVANHKKAIEYATGDYFLILSDDDYFVDRSYLSKAAGLIGTHPDLVMVYAQGYVLYEGENVTRTLLLPFRDVEPGKAVFLSRGSVKPLDFTLCNVLFRTKTARSLSPYTNEHNMSSDSELFLMMCLKGQIGVIKDFVSVYRVHPVNITSRIRKDPVLLVHNFDYVSRPYQNAKHQQLLSTDELRQWEDSFAVPELKMVLMTGILYHRERFVDLMNLLQQKCPDLYRKVMNNSKFKLQFNIAKTSRLLYYLVSGAYRREVAREKKRRTKLYQ